MRLCFGRQRRRVNDHPTGRTGLSKLPQRFLPPGSGHPISLSTQSSVIPPHDGSFSSPVNLPSFPTKTNQSFHPSSASPPLTSTHCSARNLTSAKIRTTEISHLVVYVLARSPGWEAPRSSSLDWRNPYNSDFSAKKEAPGDIAEWTTRISYFSLDGSGLESF
jgi:hypothetical protein